MDMDMVTAIWAEADADIIMAGSTVAGIITDGRGTNPIAARLDFDKSLIEGGRPVGGFLVFVIPS